MSTAKMSDNNVPQQPNIHFEETTALYASQFVISATGEEVIINFSSGNQSDAKTGESYLPVHTRIAMTSTGARRLANLVNQALSATTTSQPFVATKWQKVQ